MVRLMGRTRDSCEQLDDALQMQILDWSIKMLGQRDFVEVLLPWVQTICERLYLELSLKTLSKLIECLLQLLNCKGPRLLREAERALVLQIYELLETRFHR